MAISHIISLLTLTSAAIASPLNRRNDTQDGTGMGIKWGECDLLSLGNAPIECANLTVPLDYTKPVANETVRLSLVKVPATEKESKGSILFNFGGPGSEARQSLASLGEELQKYVATSLWLNGVETNSVYFQHYWWTPRSCCF